MGERTAEHRRDHADSADLHVSGGAGGFLAGESKLSAAVRSPDGRRGEPFGGAVRKHFRTAVLSDGSL